MESDVEATRKNMVHGTLHCRTTTIAYCPKAVARKVRHDQGRVSQTQGHEEYFISSKIQVPA